MPRGPPWGQECFLPPLPEQTASYEALLLAYVAYASNDYVVSGENLAQVDKEQLTDNAKAVYDTIWETVSETYFAQLYTDGYNSYTAGQYEAAVATLQVVVNQDMDYKDGNATYYLAQAYNRAGDMESARPYYQYIVDNYPNTEKATTARNYLNAQ